MNWIRETDAAAPRKMLETDNRKFAIYCQNMWGKILSKMKYLYIRLLSSIVKCCCYRCRGTRVNEQVASRTSWLNLIPKGPNIFSRMRFQQFTVNVFVSFWHLHINGLVKYCSISISNPLEILKSCNLTLDMNWFALYTYFEPISPLFSDVMFCGNGHIANARFSRKWFSLQMKIDDLYVYVINNRIS